MEMNRKQAHTVPTVTLEDYREMDCTILKLKYGGIFDGLPCIQVTLWGVTPEMIKEARVV